MLSRLAPKFVIRFDEEDKRDAIAELAKRNKRSMNSELLVAIDAHLQFEEGTHVNLACRVAALRNPRDIAIITALLDAMEQEP